MQPADSFDDLMARVRAGDEAAASQLFHRFASRLIALARGRLDALVRQKVDPEDVVQSVFKSFFLRHAEGQWDLGGWEGLWALLTVLTVRRCGRHAAHYRRASRDVRREAAPRDGENEPLAVCAALAREPSPAEAAELADTLGELLTSLDQRDRDIVVFSLQGYETAEVAARAGCSQRSVQRVLQWVRSRLERQE
jgi:RNA polymerase sigma-70 factor (ECF subfamily)